MNKKYFQYSKGFTLIELMIVLIIVAIFTAIAIPAYQSFIRRTHEAQVQQEIQRIATLLERHKSRNFNYLNFSINPDPTVIPVGATGGAIKYTITVWDGANTAKKLTDSSVAGQSWAIRAIASESQAQSFVMTSNGLRCKKQGSSIDFSCTGATSW